MTDIFLHILNGSIAASWLVLAVVLARLLLKKAPRFLICCLWAVVALRLLLPVLPHSDFSLVPSPQTIPPNSLLDQAPVIDSGVPILDSIINPGYTESMRPMPGASINPLQVWTGVWANLWLFGMIFMAAWAVFSWLRVRRRVSASAELAPGVMLCDYIDSPFILGLIRPQIYLPSALPEADRGPVLEHEAAHLRRLDHIWKPLGYLLLTIHWFNPVLWLAYILLCRDIELACDEHVIRDMDLSQKKEYSSALLRCSANRRLIAACPLAFGEVGVKERVKSVLHYKKPAFWIILAALVVAVVLGVGFLTDPPEEPAEILWEEVLYINDGSADALPEELPMRGYLRSVLHDSTPHPTADSQAVRLDWEYAGNEVYLDEDRLYLANPGGEGYLTFRAADPAELLTDLLTGGCTEEVTVYLPNIAITEELTGDRELRFTSLLDDLRHMELTPGRSSGTPTGVINLKRSGETIAQLNQFGEEWSLVAAGSQWRFNFPDLSDFLARWELEAEPFGSIEGVSHLRVHALSRGGVTMRFALPEDRMEYESDNRDLTFRFREAGETGWVTVRFDPDGSPAQSDIPVIAGAFTVETDTKNTWADQDQPLIDAILDSITLSRNGVSILGPSNALGVSLHVSDVTPSGLRLTITQDGTPAQEISTGSMFLVERFEDGRWVNALPPQTLWTTVAYIIPQDGDFSQNIDWSYIAGDLPTGHYRIGKHFTGTAPNPGVPVHDPDPIGVTVYAEFDIQ